MDTFWAGALFGGGAVVLLGLVSRAVLLASAERHYRAAYVATLSPDVHERLVGFEASGHDWRKFREQERERTQ